jgi:hypothetical protein
MKKFSAISSLFLVGMISIGIVSCASEPTVPATESPIMASPLRAPSPLNSPAAPPSTDVPLPGNEIALDSWVGDLDADGQNDLVLAVGDDEQTVHKVYVYSSPDGMDFTLVQEIELPEAGQFHDLVAADLDYSGVYDIGVYEARPETEEFVLFVYMSLEDTFVLSSPSGGVLDGQVGFTSLAKPAVIEDLDQGGEIEITVFIEGTSEGYLAARAYFWDGDGFSYADHLYLPGYRRP